MRSRFARYEIGSCDDKAVTEIGARYRLGKRSVLCEFGRNDLGFLYLRKIGGVERQCVAAAVYGHAGSGVRARDGRDLDLVDGLGFGPSSVVVHQSLADRVDRYAEARTGTRHGTDLLARIYVLR